MSSHNELPEKNILVVVGSDLSVNSSANLCHEAYIKGFLDNGCRVDVVTVAENNGEMPCDTANLRKFGYKMNSLYEKISKKINRGSSKNAASNAVAVNQSSESNKSGCIRRLKNSLISLYGPHEIYLAWKKYVLKFRSDRVYDLVVSLSFPPVSHLIAHELIKKGNIKAKKWLQVWEDPWCQDLVFKSLRGKKEQQKAQKEEARLLRLADRVLYVSPITLENQKAMFTEYKDKMNWELVPSYYLQDSGNVTAGDTVFGYFGDYSTKIRNLEPFYEAAKLIGANVNICGYSDKPVSSHDNIVVRPRISLQELKPIEEKANVLVFVANLKGGQIPGKIYQYSATKKTILFILDGTEEERQILKSFFGKFNRYVFCENTVDDISRAMQAIQNGDVGETENTPIEYFTPENVTKRILNAL